MFSLIYATGEYLRASSCGKNAYDYLNKIINKQDMFSGNRCTKDSDYSPLYFYSANDAIKYIFKHHLHCSNITTGIIFYKFVVNSLW